MIDALIGKIKSLNAPIVVGLDPTAEMLPEWIKSGVALPDAILAYNRKIIDAVYDLVPAVKPQIAMYERYGTPGLHAYIETIKYAKSKGLIVIADIKRGDIASTAAAYTAHLSDTWGADFATVNPYLGGDSIQPFADVCRENDKGIFVLVKTSNKGSADLQDMPLANGLAVYEHVAELVSMWGRELVGEYGYSKIGAVVGATFPAQGETLRKRMPHTFFLVPGYGAQGGTGATLRGFFGTHGRGCIINSSRGIIAAWQNDPRFGENNIQDAAREAVIAMKKDLEPCTR